MGSTPTLPTKEYNNNMPYDIRRHGSQYEVVVQGSGKVVGKHPTRAAAERHQAALYANVPEARKGNGAYEFYSEPPPGRNSAYDVESIAYRTPSGIINIDEINRLKEMRTQKSDQDPLSSGQTPNSTTDLSGTIENTDTINWRRQYLRGSNSNRRPKKDKGEIPVDHTWQGQFFPRRG